MIADARARDPDREEYRFAYGPACRACSWQSHPIDVHPIARSDMIHCDIGSHGFMTGDDTDPLKDALDLQSRVKALKALLELQRWQIEVLNERLYSSDPGGTAAKRLLALKRSEAQGLQVPKAVNDP
ncbi:hypothetical protein [Microvirga splendida]|uniref:Uncharacterized protein n=1 Tax=Microvirga splendida TaxID=2795727 RepID=A0ABS0XWR3_9HYPH|nr:hypothetical protein [Microvirga splendida]MBJ6124483.1 hypothetical protein [Microvirga splendida]